MKTPQDNMPDDVENVEDLTLFANEDFDTDDVDLFEFTGDDASPLTRLKSIILSLDWEISDDILQELTDEIKNLQQVWQDDKVAKVYLQGLHKIGTYLRSEGAYSHPNAIKLLLSFFYNFEKIISSEKITGDDITSMLKSDVRKFRILQYQINQIVTGPQNLPEATLEDDQQELSIKDTRKTATECEPLNCLKATILGLEWEVTDKGLEQFNNQIADVREQFMDNKSAQILIQGLQALGGYITDERADAHPEAFSMLHSFYEGIELLLTEKEITDEERRNILVDRVNRLNNLKAIIASNPKHDQEAVADEDLIEDILKPVDTNVEETDEEDFSDLLAQEESKSEVSFDSSEDDTQKDGSAAAGSAAVVAALAGVTAHDADDILDPSAIEPVNDKVADNFLEEELRIGSKPSPALDGTDEELPEIDTTTEEDFAEELDLFFTDEDEDIFESIEDDEGKNVDKDFEDLEIAFSDEELDLDLSKEDTLPGDTSDNQASPENLQGADKAEEDFDQLFIEEEDESLTFAPALAETEEESGFNEEEVLATLSEEPTDEIDDKLDAFFGADEESEVTGMQEEPLEQEDILVTPALADAEEEGGFNEEEAVATMAEEPTDEIEDKLDAFFGADEESEVTGMQEEPLEQEDILVTPALADAEEEGGFNEEEAVATMAEEPTAEIEDKLDAFFGADKEPSAEPDTATEEKEKGTGLLRALGVGLAALAAKPTLDQLKENKNLVERINSETGAATEQTVLLQLLNSVLTLIPEEEGYLPEKTSEVTEYLYQQIEQNNGSPDVLVTAVARVTDWQKALIKNLLSAQTEAQDSATPDLEPLTQVASEVHSGFDTLRSVLTEEFAELRKELKQKES